MTSLDEQIASHWKEIVPPWEQNLLGLIQGLPNLELALTALRDNPQWIEEDAVRNAHNLVERHESRMAGHFWRPLPSLSAAIIEMARDVRSLKFEAVSEKWHQRMDENPHERTAFQIGDNLRRFEMLLARASEGLALAIQKGREAQDEFVQELGPKLWIMYAEMIRAKPNEPMLLDYWDNFRAAKLQLDMGGFAQGLANASNDFNFRVEGRAQASGAYGRAQYLVGYLKGSLDHLEQHGCNCEPSKEPIQEWLAATTELQDKAKSCLAATRPPMMDFMEQIESMALENTDAGLVREIVERESTVAGPVDVAALTKQLEDTMDPWAAYVTAWTCGLAGCEPSDEDSITVLIAASDEMYARAETDEQKETTDMLVGLGCMHAGVTKDAWSHSLARRLLRAADGYRRLQEGGPALQMLCAAGEVAGRAEAWKDACALYGRAVDFMEDAASWIVLPTELLAAIHSCPRLDQDYAYALAKTGNLDGAIAALESAVPRLRDLDACTIRSLEEIRTGRPGGWQGFLQDWTEMYKELEEAGATARSISARSYGWQAIAHKYQQRLRKQIATWREESGLEDLFDLTVDWKKRAGHHRRDLAAAYMVGTSFGIVILTKSGKVVKARFLAGEDGGEETNPGSSSPTLFPLGGQKVGDLDGSAAKELDGGQPWGWYEGDMQEGGGSLSFSVHADPTPRAPFSSGSNQPDPPAQPGQPRMTVPELGPPVLAGGAPGALATREGSGLATRLANETADMLGDHQQETCLLIRGESLQQVAGLVLWNLHNIKPDSAAAISPSGLPSTMPRKVEPGNPTVLCIAPEERVPSEEPAARLAEYGPASFTRWIGASAQENVRRCEGKDASQEAIRKAMEGGANVLVFGCHGRFEPLDPMASALLLSDGALRVGRMRKLLAESHCSVAVLCACESGRADHTHLPSEASGIAGAVVDAGVPVVIGTLGPADALPAVLLVNRFLEELEPGFVGPSRALFRAQTWLQKASREELIAICDALHKTKPEWFGGKSARDLMRDHYPGDTPFANPRFWATVVNFGLPM